MSAKTSLSLAAMRPWMDAIPVSIFLVDVEARILEANATARETFQPDVAGTGRKLCGEYLRCDHALEAPNGCGSTDACQECAVRQAVTDALQGQPVSRKPATMKIRRGDLPQRFHLLISGTPLDMESQPSVLLTMEDVTRLVELHSILPVCSHCRRVRNDQAAWEKLEAFLSEHFDIRFSHSICPECCEKLYGAQAP